MRGINYNYKAHAKKIIITTIIRIMIALLFREITEITEYSVTVYKLIEYFFVYLTSAI